MSSKHLPFLVLTTSILTFAATVSAQPNIKNLLSADSGEPITTVAIEPGGNPVSISLIIENTKENQPIDVTLICEQPGIGGCRDIGGRMAYSDDEFSGMFKIPAIPPNGLVTLELKADIPINDKYHGALLFTDSEGKATVKRLTFTRNFPAWAEPADSNKPTEQTLKVGRSGIAAARIVANELVGVDPEKITLTLSEFLNEADSSAASVGFVAEAGDRKIPAIRLGQIDLSTGVFTVKFDASELQAGQIYRGRLNFDVVGAPPPPPLTLRLERLAPERKPVLIAEQAFTQVEAHGETVIDIQVREKEGALPLQGIKFAWGHFVADDGRQAPDIDLLRLNLHVNGKVVPLWSGSRSYSKDGSGSEAGGTPDNSTANIPAGSEAILRISSTCPSALSFWQKPPWASAKCLEPGKYRLPLVLWTNNSDRAHDAKLNVDFFVHRSLWIPVSVLFAAILIAYFMNRWRNNSNAADAVLNDIRQLLKGPALNLERCALLPIVQTKADVKRVQAAMERERSGYRRLLMSHGVTEAMKVRLDVITKRIAQVDRLGRLWEVWHQYDKPSVSHRVLKELRKVAGAMSDKIRSDEEFDNELDKSQEKIESLSDPDALRAEYIEQSMSAIRKLLNSVDLRDYDDERGLRDLLDELRNLDIQPLTELPKAIADLDTLKGKCADPCRAPEPVILVLEHWSKSGKQELDALVAAKQELTIALEGGSVETLVEVSNAFAKLVEKLNRAIWKDLNTIDDLGELSALDVSSSSAIGMTLDSVRAILTKLAEITKTATPPISDRDLVGILHNPLEHAQKSPPEQLEDAERLDRSFYVPLKLIHDQTIRNKNTSTMSDLFNVIRDRLDLTDSQSRPLKLSDADVDALYAIVDGQVWSDLQRGEVRFDSPEVDEVFHAYQMIEFRISPITGEAPGIVNARVADSYAFNHGFVYQWKMELGDDLRIAPKRWYRDLLNRLKAPQIQTPQPPMPLTTREPTVQLYAPWETAKCKATVQIFPSEEQVGITAPIEKAITAVMTRSEVRKRNAQLRFYDGLNMILVFAAAAFAGFATDQFTAAMHGSYTALFTLFTTGMALQQLRDWTFGNS